MSRRQNHLFVQTVAALALIGCSWLVGCSSARTEYFLLESQGRTTLEIGVSKFGVCTNLHGGCAQTFQFVFPAKTSVVPAAAILSYRVDYKIPEPSELPETGQITLTIAPSGCDILIDLFTKSGKPLPINGNFKQARCGK